MPFPAQDENVLDSSENNKMLGTKLVPRATYKAQFRGRIKLSVRDGTACPNAHLCRFYWPFAITFVIAE